MRVCFDVNTDFQWMFAHCIYISIDSFMLANPSFMDCVDGFCLDIRICCCERAFPTSNELRSPVCIFIFVYQHSNVDVTDSTELNQTEPKRKCKTLEIVCFFLVFCIFAHEMRKTEGNKHKTRLNGVIDVQIRRKVFTMTMSTNKFLYAKHTAEG